MTPVFCCGFECGQIGSVGQHWPAPSYASISTTTVRTGARSLRINPAAVNTASTPLLFQGTTFDSAQIVMRFYINFTTLPDADVALIQAFTGASLTVGGLFFKLSDNSIYTGTGGAASGATGYPIVTGKWYCIDLYIDNTRLVKAKVDGNALGDATSTSTATITKFNLTYKNATWSSDMFIDDFVLSVTAADYPIGQGKVFHFIPTSDGTHNIAGTGDFQRTLTGTDILNATTTAFQLVDDVPLESGASVDWINMILPPNATDYVECIFGPASGVPTPVYGPRAVEVIAGIHQAGTGTGNMAILLRDNATSGTIYTATTVAGTTTITYKRAHFGTPPSGGVWGVASGNGNFNNVRFRFGSPAAVDANPDQYLDCIMIEAEFAERPQKALNINQSVNRASTY